jgi:mannan endo-1,4-beta-mannosidase
VRDKTRTRLLHGTAIVGTVAFLAFACARQTHFPSSNDAATTGAVSEGTPSASAAASASSRPSPSMPEGVAALRSPLDRKYLGVAIDGVPRSMAPFTAFARSIGKTPNLVTYFQRYGHSLTPSHVTDIHSAGALPVIQLEPYEHTTAAIASGATDAYLVAYGQALKRVNLPVVISFGHEMNGDWYPWGTGGSTPANFVAAWRKIHNTITRAGADKVIWLWNPNVVNPRPSVRLAPYYPGDQYVDWIGLTGYYHVGAGAPRTFERLFGPTIQQVRAFTGKPFLIAETGAAASAEKPRQIEDLFTQVAARREVLGFVWFNYEKAGAYESNWKIDSDPRSKATFVRLAQNPQFGFPIG